MTFIKAFDEMFENKTQIHKSNSLNFFCWSITFCTTFKVNAVNVISTCEKYHVVALCRYSGQLKTFSSYFAMSLFTLLTNYLLRYKCHISVSNINVSKALHFKHSLT